jgi:hypothetical protein
MVSSFGNDINGLLNDRVPLPVWNYYSIERSFGLPVRRQFRRIVANKKAVMPPLA